MPEKLFVANWKQYVNIEDAVALFAECAQLTSDWCNVIIAPNHLSLYPCSHIETLHALASQDAFYENDGAYTSAVLPQHLVDVGVSYTIVGHSERRTYMHETDQEVNKKVSSLLKHGIIPIVCVGETREQRDNNEQEKVVREQVAQALENVDPKDVIIAYEPRWAISGSGEGASITPNDAVKMHELIKKHTDNTRVLYGGSVNPENIQSFVEHDSIDGVLVGSASTKLDSLKRML